MLEIQNIRENKEAVILGLKKRHFANAENLIEEAINLDQERRNFQLKFDQVQAESNNLSKQIGALMQVGKKDEAESIKSKTGQLKEEAKNFNDKSTAAATALQDLLYKIPNVPHESVKAGRDAEDNETLRQNGDARPLEGDVLPHWDLIKKYDIIDFDLGSKISGAGFPVYKGKGARLQRAMINFFLDRAVEAGYVEVQPPILVNEASGYGTGQLPDKDGQMYHMPEDNLYVIPTAEVPITNMYRDMILEDDQLPVMHVGYTPCFRREAGSWGAHVRGLNRLHQFDKVEIVQIAHPDKSYQILEEMANHVSGLLEALQLPYRVLRLCGGDMGFTSALTYDMEVYSAAQQRWLEVSSVSNFETYQANRLKLRHRPEAKKTALLHTLNGSALALPRIVAAILENNQSPEGIRIPKVLVPYAGFEVIS